MKRTERVEDQSRWVPKSCGFLLVITPKGKEVLSAQRDGEKN
jgi:hypothetical protein